MNRDLLRDNAQSHTAVAMKNLLQRFGREVFDHPPYSPDLVPTDFHFFALMKRWLGGPKFATDHCKELTENTGGCFL